MFQAPSLANDRGNGLASGTGFLPRRYEDGSPAVKKHKTLDDRLATVEFAQEFSPLIHGQC